MSRDVALDVTEDSAGDGGPDDPEWVRLEGQPPGVDLLVARRPERVLHVGWEDCGGGCLVASCGGCSFVRGFVDGDSTYARVQIAGPEQTATLTDIASGVPVAAWQQWDNDDPRGRLAFPAVGGGRVAISAKSYPATGADLVSVWGSPIEETALRIAPIYQLESDALIVNLNLISASHQAWTMSPTNDLFLRDAGDRIGRFPGADADGMIQEPALVGDRVFYELWGDHARVWTATIDEAPRVLIDAAPGEVRDFRTDGRTMTWYQGYDFDPVELRFALLELWTSPFAARTEDLAPRRVPADLRGLIVPTQGGHWVAVQTPELTLNVYDLNDGSRREWVPPDEGNVTRPALYATDDEILVATTVGTFRIDPNTLAIVR